MENTDSGIQNTELSNYWGLAGGESSNGSQVGRGMDNDVVAGGCRDLGCGDERVADAGDRALSRKLLLLLPCH